MNPQKQQGYLVLADISGFVSFLSGVELDHAQAILRELLELIARHFEPALTVSQTYNDAVLAYSLPAREPRGDRLLDVLEATYSAFRDHLERIRRRTTCTCRACRTVPALELKFLVHYGEYLRQTIAGRTELLGNDVEVVRKRLLKDQLSGEQSAGAYVLITAHGLARMGVHADDMSTHSGSYEHLGDIHTHRLDLHSRYRQLLEARRVRVQSDDADAVLARDFDAPPSLVWEWLNDPHKRTRWMRGRTWKAALRPGGRTGAGARNHCDHGVGSLIETILDWRPFDYFTVEMQAAPGSLRALQTYQLKPLDDGRRTRLHSYVKLSLGGPSWLRQPMCNLAMSLLLKPDLARMAELMRAELTAHAE